MKTLLLITLLFNIAINSNAQIPNLQWAKNIGGSRGDDIKTDAAGNVYTTGYFSGVADFDPGPGTFYLTADGGGADDAYVSKLDTYGNFLWAARLGGDATNYNFSVEVDASGNVYSAGRFSGTVDFDPGPGIFNITSLGQYDIGISKLDAAGNFVWAKRFGGTQSETANALLIDDAGNICITGIFVGIADFDPGPAVFNLNGNGVFGESFIAKLNADGNFIWAKEIDGYFAEGFGISKDATGNLYVCGTFDQAVDLDPGVAVFNVTTSGAADAFLVKLDVNGNFIWGKSFGGIGSQTCKSVAVDATGNVLLTGYFPFTVDFDPGAAVFNITALGASDAYVLKLDGSGNFIWAKVFSGTAADNANDIAVDVMGNVFVTGLFQFTADFDPGPGVYNLTALSNDIYIAKLDAAGNFGWAIKYGGTTLDAGLSIFVAATGNIYATGFFEEVVDFDPGPGITTLNSSTGRTFIVNLGNGTLPLTLLEFSGKNTVVGNELIWKTAQEINTSHFEIQWSSNGQQFNSISTLPAAGNSTQTKQYRFLHTQPLSGNNFYRLKMVDADGRFTYSNIVTVQVKSAGNAVDVFPNPVVQVMQLKITSLKNETVQLQLINAMGMQVASKQIHLSQGLNIFSWDIKSVATGKYFLVDEKKQYQPISIIKQEN
ncbi:MAG TPA: T9SS type A sorting domain-containing protein [Ferruginibacter sp.]|nr:T9SS type A sorting domain-containing protein [Ferruginibacter sp.]HRE65048.1 T9SS type A sorting domain-containing protein [Ferruginibacter sp.]